MPLSNLSNITPQYIKTDHGWATTEPILPNPEKPKSKAPKIVGAIVSAGAAAAVFAYAVYGIKKLTLPEEVKNKKKLEKLVNTFKQTLEELKISTEKFETYANETAFEAEEKLLLRQNKINKIKSLLENPKAKDKKKKLINLKKDIEKELADTQNYPTHKIETFYETTISTLSTPKSSITQRKQNIADEMNNVLGKKNAKNHVYDDFFNNLDKIESEQEPSIFEISADVLEKIEGLKKRDVSTIKQADFESRQELYRLIQEIMDYVSKAD